METNERAITTVTLEGLLLDDRNWDGWLELYLPEAEFHVPCWDDEYTLTTNPRSETSLIYYPDRSGLEDRVFRLRTERSMASTPLPRTCHMVSGFRCCELDSGDIEVKSNWITHSYRLKQQHSYFGQQVHVLRELKGELKFISRKVIVANDRIANVLDIYSI